VFRRNAPKLPKDDCPEILQSIGRSHILVKIDAAGKVIHVNPAFSKITGRRSDEVVGHPLAAMLRPMDKRATWVEQIHASLSNGEDTSRIFPVISAKGQELWLSGHFSHIGSEASGQEEILLIARDITENHIRRRDNRGQVDAIHRSMAVVEFDLDGTVTDANERFCTTLGYTREELIGKPHGIFVPESEKKSPEYTQFWARLEKGSSESGLVRRVAKGGDDLWLEATYETLKDGDDRPFKVVKYAFDVTAVKNSEAESKALIEAIRNVQAYIEFTPAGEIVSVNDLFCQTFGYTRSELIGQNRKMLVEPGEVASSAYAEFWSDLASGVVKDGNFTRLGKDGNRVHVRGSYNPIRNASGKIEKIIKIAVDATTFHTTALVMSDGLERFAKGDLDIELTTDLGELDPIRRNFNGALAQVRGVLGNVSEKTVDARSEAASITAATNQLARRTEKQAATLEETTAALDELTSSVHESAEYAREARKMASGAADITGRSEKVVQSAMSAMDAISESSTRISSITSTIDDISFQTNLLALNAGVEAARAGDAGRGFAVVASEVRALAVRSSEAAREIAGLITMSGDRVKQGVELVRETGAALQAIDEQVRTIRDRIEQIAGASEDQANQIKGMNESVSSLDQVTQRNAAMAEETSAAVETLEGLVERIGEELAFFRSGTAVSSPTPKETEFRQAS